MFREENSWTLTPLIVPLIVVGGFGGILGAVSGFIIGLFYSDGFRVGLAVRLLVALGIPVFVVLPFVIVWGADPRATIYYTLIMGLLPAIATTPRLVRRLTQGEVQ